MSNKITPGLWVHCFAGTLVALVMAGPGFAQLPAAGLSDGSVLAPPALPGLLPNGLLPNGLPVPNLPPEAQQEILQRLRDAAAGRTPPLGGPLPAPSAPAAQQPAYAAQPAAPPAAASLAEPLSHTETFFAGRLGLALRQFGYDSFSADQGISPAFT